MDSEELKKKLKEIDDLVSSNIIDDEKAKAWKGRIIAEFERGLPAPAAEEKPKTIMDTTDVQHLPGRLIGHGLELGKAFVQGCGKTYEGLSKDYGYLEPDGQPGKKKKPPRNPDELLDDLPPQFR